MENANKNIDAFSDAALLDKIGTFIRTIRLQQNKTQQDIADAAGVNRSTLVNIENGGGGTMLSLVQVLRALNQLHVLEVFTSTAPISPLELAKAAQKQRLRARGNRPSDTQPESDW